MVDLHHDTEGLIFTSSWVIKAYNMARNSPVPRGLSTNSHIWESYIVRWLMH